MVNSKEFKRLLYEHEVLWARFNIRDHYLDRIVQEVYQNIGQVLSLVRIQLNLLSNHNEAGDVTADEPGKLVGKVIQDLRAMCRSFYPETELLTNLGLIQTLEYELKLSGIDKAKDLIKVRGTLKPLYKGTELIVFGMLQEMLFSISKEYKGIPIQVKIVYDKNGANFIIEYKEKPIEWKQFNLQLDADFSLTRLNLSERADLIKAKLEIKYSEANKTCIKLIVPFKTSMYE
jgi:signal transduction histidine kinase